MTNRLLETEEELRKVMEQRLKNIMADVFGIQQDNITDNVSMENTEQWDSLKHMELIAAIEEEFDISLTADEIVELLSVVKIKEVFRKRGVVI